MLLKHVKLIVILRILDLKTFKLPDKGLSIEEWVVCRKVQGPKIHNIIEGL